MHRVPTPRRRRSGMVAAAAVGAVLVLLPGICSAAVAVLAPHAHTAEWQDALRAPRGQLGGGGAEHDHHRPADPAPASDEVPERGADHCATHDCCVMAVKGEARHVELGAPIAIDAFDLAAASPRAPAQIDSKSAPGHDVPSGPPGLKATNSPLRR